MADVDGGMFAAAGSSPAELAASEAVGQQLSAEADIASAAQVLHPGHVSQFDHFSLLSILPDTASRPSLMTLDSTSSLMPLHCLTTSNRIEAVPSITAVLRNAAKASGLFYASHGAVPHPICSQLLSR